MRRFAFVVLIALLVFGVARPTQAQSEDCLAHLDRATELLRTAQQQAAEGQLDRALETAAAANALLSEIRLRCATANAEIPTETYAVDTRAAKFSVRYPQGWTLIALETGIPLTSELMASDGLPSLIFTDARATGFDARQIVLMVGLPDRLASTFLRSDQTLFSGVTNPAFLLNSLITAAVKNAQYHSTAQPLTAGDVEAFTINDLQMAAVTFSAGRNNGAMVLVRLPNEQFALLMGVGNIEGKRNTPEILRALCLLMASTLEVID